MSRPHKLCLKKDQAQKIALQDAVDRGLKAGVKLFVITRGVERLGLKLLPDVFLRPLDEMFEQGTIGGIGYGCKPTLNEAVALAMQWMAEGWSVAMITEADLAVPPASPALSPCEPEQPASP